jgi:Domain of unknown function (DUF4266)
MLTAKPLVACVLAALLSGCVTVRAQQRAALADPIMEFDGEARAEALRVHAIGNREGSSGGSGVAGGGCGCN